MSFCFFHPEKKGYWSVYEKSLHHEKLEKQRCEATYRIDVKEINEI